MAHGEPLIALPAQLGCGCCSACCAWAAALLGEQDTCCLGIVVPYHKDLYFRVGKEPIGLA